MQKTNDPVRQLYYDAIKAYGKAVKHKGYPYNQPAESMTEMDKEHVYLHNANGPLATYNFKTGEVKLP